ncbi:Zinc finger, CCHC domain-containing protein [Actinomortierella ambigua]|nr:Zinc finger, CCHC domain-containing protein [Actinomortierella ambigua]
MVSTATAMISSNDTRSTHIKQLTDDMEALVKKLELSPEGKEQRENLITRIQGILNSEWPKELRVDTYGSFMSGLSSDESDLDLVVMPALQGQDQDLTGGEGTYRDIFILKRLLQRHGMKDVEAISKARVSILRFTDPRTDISVDLSYGHYIGVYNTRLVEAYTRIDARIRPFLFILKAFVRARGICAPGSGSLSSFAYCMMAIAYFQTLLVPVLPCLQDPHLVPHRVPHTVSGATAVAMVNVAFTDPDRVQPCLPRNSMTLGDMFVGFLELYGSKFDYKNMGVSIRCGGVESRVHLSPTWARDPFTIEDPFLFDINMGQVKSPMLDIIRHEFQAAIQAIRDGRGLHAILTKRRPYVA